MGKSCSEVELAYIAGFLDADGAIMALIEKHTEKRFGFRVRVILKFTHHDREVLDWMQKKLGVGLVRAHRPNTDKQTFDLHIRNQEHVHAVLQLLNAHIRVKKQQTKIAIQILEIPVISKKDIIKIADLADTLSGFNVRSKNRRQNYAIKIKEHLSRND